MNINTVSMIALLASLGLAQPVLAQTDQQQPAGAEQTQQNAPEQPDTAAQPPAGGSSTEQQTAAPEGEAGATSTEQQTAAPEGETTGTSTEQQTAAPEADADKTDMTKMSATDGGQIILQDNDTFLASDFVGTNVYSSEDENLGEVTDLIFAKDGTLQGVVIGVGGFLGIGQKNVAFTLDRIQMTENEEGIRLSLAATREELSDAEPFKSKQTQKVEADAEKARQEQESRATTGAATPNPAAPPSQ